MELDEFVPSAKETSKFYDPIVFLNTELKENLKFSWSKVNARMHISYQIGQCRISVKQPIWLLHFNLSPFSA